MKATTVLIGNFGSGKSELALNLAMRSVRGGSSTVLVDLDIINPYFRSAERKHMLEQNGVKLIYPTYAMTGVESPTVPPDVYSVFIDEHETVLFDVGGDPSGAVALGQFKRNFDELGQLHVLCVVNCMRPFSATLEQNLTMMAQIQTRCRLAITGIVNNANLSYETTPQVIAEGYSMVERISRETGIPVVMTSGMKAPLSGFVRLARELELDPSYMGETYEIERYMRRDWESFTTLGI
ncbi:MAG: ATP-binding protein [Clostridia bacterium]|nr:ATP-binding protein [Clostridia bacterium]